MGTTMNEISIPVRLKILQDSIQDFQRILDNLQPNTKNWKDLNKLITSMTTEAQKLQAQLSQPFSSQKQFNSTSRTIDKLEEAAARVKVVMEGVKFSDIKLTPQQTQELQRFENEINQIRASYKQLMDDTKAKLISQDNNKNLLGMIPRKDVLNKDFNEIQAAVDQHVKNLERSVENQKAQFDRLKSNIELGERATILTSSKGGLTREALGDSIFDKYLAQTENGLRVRSQKNGITKQALLKEIEEMFSIPPGELQKMAGKTINDINKAFQEMGKEGQLNLFGGVIARGKNSKKNESTMQLALKDLQDQLNQYQLLQNEIAKLKNQELTPASAANDTKISELTAKMDTLKSSILNTSAAMSNYKSGAQQMAAASNYLRTTLEQSNAAFLKMQSVTNSFNSIKMMITNFMGFHQVLNLTRKAVQQAAQHIKELDSVMNKISIVTNMDTSDLWGQIDQYSQMAQRFGTTIKGAYEVSQIYYQQGLDTSEVLTLTNETLKLAKVSGLDYASTTDYMTTALRGFKMEMSEASTVVDVYSNLAANTAVSQEELAVAMSKTASSMESVGSSFEETSAMIATMVAVTRESATNIGSALKSIAARYGEMKSNPLTMTDEDGEELVYNKVDAALQSVGITMKDSEGQFRSFTEVITELAEKWDTLESTQQRYIATQFAGNRQQSRFLALVSNKDLLAENIEVAENSEDIGTVQALKALDSLESKIAQVQVAYQQFYTSIGIETAWKGFLDGARSVIDTLNGMPKIFGKIPVAALNSIAIIISLLKNLAYKEIGAIAQQIGSVLSKNTESAAPQMQKAGETLFEKLNSAIASKLGIAKTTGAKLGESYAQGVNSGFLTPNTAVTQTQYNDMMRLAQSNTFSSSLNGVKTDRDALVNLAAGTRAFTDSGMQIIKTGQQQEVINLISSVSVLKGTIDQENASAQAATGGITAWAAAHGAAAANLLGVSQALQIVALAIPTATKSGKVFSGTLQAISGAGIAVLSVLTAISKAASTKTALVMPWTQIAMGVVAVVSGLVQVLSMINNIDAEVEEATKKAEELTNKAKELKAAYKTIDSSINKLKELEKTRYDSAEAAEKYQTAVDDLAETYPQLISSYDEQNRVVINANAMEQALTEAREKSALATLNAAVQEGRAAKLREQQDKQKIYTSNDRLDRSLFYTNKLIDRDNWWFADRSAPKQFQAMDENKRKTWVDDFNAAMKNYNKYSEPENLDANKALQYLTQMESLIASAGFTLNDSRKQDIIDSRAALTNYVTDLDTQDIANRAIVTSELDYKYRLPGSQSIFKESQGLFDRAVDYIFNTIDSGNKDFSPGNISNLAEDLVSDVDEFFNSLTSERKEEIEDLLEHPEKYTIKDLGDLAPQLNNTPWIRKSYNSSATYNMGRVTRKLNLLDDEYNENKSSQTILDSNEIKQLRPLASTAASLNLRNLAIAGINQAQLLKKNGYEPDDFIAQFNPIFQGIYELPVNLRNSLIDNFINNGFTKEGLTKTQAWLNSAEIKSQLPEGSNLSDLLQPMIESTIENLSLTLQTLNDMLTENLGNYESLVSDLTNGVKGSKLTKTIQQAKSLLGVDLKFTDFQEIGDEFILMDSVMTTVFDAMKDKYTGGIEQYEANVKHIETQLEKSPDQAEYDTAQYRLLLSTDYNKYFDDQGKLKSEIQNDNIKYNEFLQLLHDRAENLVNTWNNFAAYEEAVMASLQKTSAWKKGDYSSLGEDAYAKIKEYAADPSKRDDTYYNDADWASATEMYQSGINQALSDLTNYGVDYVRTKAANAAYQGIKNQDLVTSLIGRSDKAIIRLTKEWVKSAGLSIAEANSYIIKAINAQNGLGKDKAVADLISGGDFTGSDLEQFLASYYPKKSVEEYVDNQGKLKGKLGEVYHFDAATASYKINDDASFDDVLAAYQATFESDIKKGSELYKQLYKDWIDNKIKNNEKNDANKQFVSALSTLASAKVGTTVNLVDSPELQAALKEMGVIIENESYKVMSEYARDSLILGLESTSDEVNAVLEPLKESINQKRSKGAAQQGVMSQSFTRENLRNYLRYATARGELVDNDTDEVLDNTAKAHGFTWDKNLQKYIISDYEKALEWYDNMINDAIYSGGSSEYVKQLRQDRGKIAAEFNKDEKYEALSNLLNNYEDAGNYIDEINTQFGVDLKNIEGAITTVNGKEVINKDKVKQALKKEDVEKYSFLFDDLTDQITDTYIDSISKAGTLAMTGTSSQIEMKNFTKAFQKIFPNEEPTFIYDTLLNNWTLDINDAIRIIKESAKNITFNSPADRQAYIQNQIDNLFADELDFSKFLAGTATEKENATLRSSLEKYYQSKSALPESERKQIIDTWIDNTLSTLSSGGIAAVNELKSKDKDATSDELKAAYEAQIAPIRAAADSVESLEKGSFVATEQIEALKQAGFKFDGNIVVSTAEDLSAAYKSLYEQMAGTGEATVSELNSIAAKALDSQYKQKRNLSDTLSKGIISFSDLTQLYTDAGKMFGVDTGKRNEKNKPIYDYSKEVQALEAAGKIAVDELGNVKILDFKGVAEDLSWKEGSEKYAAAYSKYIDQVISDRTDTINERAKAQLSALMNAKAGESVKVSDLPPEVKAQMKNMGADIDDGIYEVTNEYAKDNMILALKSYDTGLNTLLRQYKESLNQNRAKGTAQLGVMDKTFTRENLRDYLKNVEGRNAESVDIYSDRHLNAIAENRGYTWIEELQRYVLTDYETAINDYDQMIKKAADKYGNDNEYTQQLREARAKISQDFHTDKKYNALSNLLANYENAGSYIDAITTQFGVDLTQIEGAVTTIEGRQVIDKDKVYEALGEDAEKYAFLFDNLTDQIADTYIDNISKAGTLAMKGTSSHTEMEGFTKAFQKLFPDETPTFVYDVLLNNWTLDISDAIRLIKESAKDITFGSEADRQAYIQNQIDNLFTDNLDFSKFLAGTATEKENATLRSNLEKYYQSKLSQYSGLPEKEREQIINTWVDNTLSTLSKGGQEAVKELQSLKQGEATSEELKAAYEAQIAPIQAAAEVIDSLEVGSFVATEQIEALQKAGFVIQDNVVVKTAEDLTTAYQLLYDDMAATGEATVSELNKIAAQALNRQYAQKRNLSDTLSKSTIGISDLIQLYTDQDIRFGTETDKLDRNGKKIIDYSADLQNLVNKRLINIDELGNIKIADFHGMAAELGWKAGTEEYAAAYSQFVDSVVSDRSKTSSGRARTQLSNLISAKAGDAINVTDLPSNIKEKLGIVGADAIEIMSEAQRDNWILALDATEETDIAVRDAILEAQKSIKEKRNLSTNTTAVVAAKVSQSAAESLAVALGQDVSEAARIMEERGYIFDNYTQEWNASAEVLKNLARDMYIAQQQGASAEDIANLEAAYNNLKYELQNQKYNAVQDIVNNYQDLSEESVAAFKTAFADTEINVQEFINTDQWGKNTIDLAGLNQKLVEVGYDINQLFQQEITAIGDSYLKNISTGVSLLSTGTNNLSEIGTFVKSYNETMGTQFEAEQVTYYDETLKAFTIQPDFIRAYIQQQAENLKAQGIIPEDKVEQWITDNTVGLARQNIDIKGFLAGERTQNDINKLGKALETYYELYGENFKEIQSLVNQDIAGLQKGGSVAVQIAKRINPNFTESDLAEIYSSAIKGWNSALSEAENLTVGQVVTGELKQALSNLNMVDANGVVTSVENMSGVYWQIFHQMQLTAGSTLTELNKAYAKALEAKELKESKPVEMIKNAVAMSYTQLGEYLADSGVQLWEVLGQEARYGIEALGGGKVRISDFTKFAGEMGWETDTEEYIEAFKSYNDSLINYRKQTKTQMQSELQTLSQMTKSGDVNITRIASEYNLDEYLPAEELTQYGATLKNGILTLNDSADIAGLTEKLGQLVVAEGGMTKDEFNKLMNDVEVQAKLRESGNKKKINTAAAYKDIFSNYDSISIEMIGNLATQLDTTYEDVVKQLDLTNQQADGTYKVSLTKLKQIAETATGELQQQLLEQIADIENNILSSISSAGGFAREGTSSMSEMQKFINEYNALTGEQATIAKNFVYDGALKAFTLTPDMLTKYTEAQKKQLEELGLSGKAIDQYINDQLESVQRENIDIESLISAQGTAERNATATELARQIQQLSNYSDIQKMIGKDASATIDEAMNAIYSVLSAGGDKAVELVKAIKGDKVTASDISTAYNAGIERLRTALNELEVHTGSVVNNYTAAILNAVGIETKDLENGTSVVTTLDTNIKTDQLTSAYAALYNALKRSNEKTVADLNTAYAKILTSAESQEINAINTLQNAVSMTWEQLGEILTQEGIQLEDAVKDMDAYGVGSIGAGKVRIYDFTKFAKEMGWDPSSDEYVSAYKAYNDGLIALNNQAEKAIVEEVKSLSSAKGGDWLNFTQLWTALEKATQEAMDNIAPEDYKGNVDLSNRPIVLAETMQKVFKNFEDDYATLYSTTFMSENFGDFENSVGLLFTSITAAGEPVADLAAYVQRLYEEANGDVEKIRELDKQDRQLFLHGLQNTTPEKMDEYGIDLHNRGAAKDTIRYYNQVLEDYGARFVDGIFQLEKDANLFGVASTLQSLLESGVIEIEDGLAEIEDAIVGILKAYADAIGKGIEGGLTNVEMQDLVQKATDLGLSDIQFEKTAEGFKLVETSAIQLYYALKQIDSLQAGQIFDKLRESLEKTNENFKSSSALAAHITNIRNGTYAADNKISQARKDQYQAELEIAQEILAVRATSEDSSFNFMSNSIPAAQNNPLNYFSNWASAIKKIKTAMKTTTKDTKGKSHKGLIDYQDWYNIVTEMNNIAALGGEFEVAGVKLNGSMEAAAALIEKGANALVATKTGDLKVAMGDIGVEFKAGAGGMKQGIDDGIKAMAQSQIDMLDGMIQLLETIVAMEKLGDIAGEDNVIDIHDIFPKIIWDDNGKPLEGTFEEFDKDYETIVGYILDAAEKNEDLNKGLENLKINGKSIKDIFSMDASTLANLGKDFNEAYAATLQAMVTAARSGNYDENDVMRSLQDVFAEAGLDNIVLDTGKMAIVLKAGNISTINWDDESVKGLVKKYGKDYITTSLQNFMSNEVSQEDIKIALTIKGVYEIDSETGLAKSIKWNGRKIDVSDAENFKKAEIAHYLKSLRVINDEESFDLKDLTGKQGTYKVNYKIGERELQVNIHSDDNETKVTFHSDITDKDYNSAQELYTAEYKYKLDELYWSKNPQADPYNDKYDNEKYAALEKEYTYDMYMWQVNRVHANTKTVIQTKDGKTVDLNNQGSMKARDALQNIYNQSSDDFESWVKKGNASINDAGDIEIKAGEYDIVLSGKGIVKTDGKNESIDTSELQAAIGKNLLGADLALQENIAGGIIKGISSLGSSFGEAATTAGSLADAMERIASAAQMLQNTQWSVIADGLKSLNNSQNSQQQPQNSQSSDNKNTAPETANITTIVTKFEPDVTAVEKAKKDMEHDPAIIQIEGEPYNAINTAERIRDTIDAMGASINITTTNSATSVINSITAALRNLTNGGKPYQVTVQARVAPTGSLTNGKTSPLATGNFGLAKSKGTLMGELGPELVVSKGHYFIVGQNGPEMVDLADDAIVFNHLQTQSLLTKGMSKERGRAVTNEQNAVSFATGNVNGGPAMASASAALATLRQLRAMWESLLTASVSDIAGGGGGGGDKKIVDPKAWVKTVERWYNLTQEIAKLEKEITHEEALRSKLQSDFSKNGKHYYQSQKQSISALKQQIDAQEQLNLSREDYYQRRITALKDEPLGKLYTFDENGQLHFRNDVEMNGQQGAMNFLTNLMGFDENGKANYTNKQKYDILKQYGFDEYMRYNSNGEQILLDADHSGDVSDEERETYYQQATEAWRDRMDSFAKETQSLWDTIQEGQNNLLELQTTQNELLQEMVDNQLEVEENVMKAIEDMRQREIDALQDERDKLEESTGKYIEGLTNALNKEQEMYNNQEQENTLNQQRRRLAILQRSGGSAADIANLQSEIDSNERSQYFDLQQQQIDAIQEASDLQIERMDTQIQLMTETLDYQKEFGLLWSNVYEVMNESAAVITNFIMQGNSEFWAKSPLGTATGMNNTLFQAEQWVQYRQDLSDVHSDVAVLANATRKQEKTNDFNIYNDAMTKEYGQGYDSNGKYKQIFDQVYDKTGDLTQASTAARLQYQKDRQAEEEQRQAAIAAAAAVQPAPAPTPAPTPAPAPAAGNTQSKANSNDKWGNITSYQYEDKGNSGHNKYPVYSIAGARPDKGKIEAHDKDRVVNNGGQKVYYCSKCGHYMYAEWASGPANQGVNNTLKNNTAENNIGKKTTKTVSVKVTRAKGYASGGIDDETGLAMLHGTKARPEAVLNAAQTQILRDNILSNKPNSLITLLNTYNQAHKDGIAVPAQASSEAIVIENASVNMNVQQIANDYDARRAGEQALNEMMRIARKTSAANSIRR